MVNTLISDFYVFLSKSLLAGCLRADDILTRLHRELICPIDGNHPLLWYGVDFHYCRNLLQCEVINCTANHCRTCAGEHQREHGEPNKGFHLFYNKSAYKNFR